MLKKRTRKAVVTGPLTVYKFGQHVNDGRLVATIVNESHMGRATTTAAGEIAAKLAELGLSFRTGDKVTVTIAITPRKVKKAKK